MKPESRIMQYSDTGEVPSTFGIVMRFNAVAYEMNYVIAVARMGYADVEHMSKFQAARADLWYQAEMEKWVLTEGFRHEAVQWLIINGHNFLPSVAPWKAKSDHTILRLTIKDKDAAMLFKLTWVGGS